MYRVEPEMVGWYGLRSTDGRWSTVTSDEMANTLLLPTAVSLGATHVGYWSGKNWEHVEAIDRTFLPK